MNVSFNWLKKYIPDIPNPQALRDTFMYHLCEVESMEQSSDDTVFDLNILPNRAHDLLGHQGIAREVAGQLELSFTDEIQQLYIPESKPTTLNVSIESDVCRRYSARIVRGIKIGPSPEWMVALLTSIGQRSINNIVDATNFVMFDIGQPTHAFDLKKNASEKITIRHAVKGEALITLDGKEVLFQETDLVITDGVHALAIAGVKGGSKAEVDETTIDIVLEVANFDPVTVRKTARRLGILTDSAKRFENDISPELVDDAMKKLSSLIGKLCPDAVFEDIVDIYPYPQKERTLTFALSKINSVLGSTITIEEVENILRSYHFVFNRIDEVFTIEVPPLRLDLSGDHDMIEEIGRIYGYDRIVPNLPAVSVVSKQNETLARIRAARRELLADGYKEVYTYTFGKKGGVEVAYGAKGKEYLRPSIAEGIKASYELNRQHAPLLGKDEIKIFEIGAVFPRVDEEVINVAYADKEGIIEESLTSFTDGMDLALHEESLSLPSTKFVPWSIYPFITRDVAVWTTEANRVVLERIVTTFATAHCVRPPECFDSFMKNDRLSLAYRFVFQSFEKTLTDEEVNSVMQLLYAAIKKEGVFEIR